MPVLATAARKTEGSPQVTARVAGVFYLLTFAAGGTSLFVRGKPALIAGLIAGACYVVVTLLFYFLFRAVNRRLSALALVISLAGCAIGPLGQAHLAPTMNPLIFFGFYCLLIGCLIAQSTFLPRTLGALMAFAGLGWLTFLYPPLAHTLSPYNIAPGLIGEGALTLWLLAKGVNEREWKAQAGIH